MRRDGGKATCTCGSLVLCVHGRKINYAAHLSNYARRPDNINLKGSYTCENVSQKDDAMTPKLTMIFVR